MPPPNLTRPDNPLDRRIAIMHHYEQGLFVGAKTAEDIRTELGGTARSISNALSSLGFTTAERSKVKRVKTGQGRRTRLVRTPARYAPPANLDWPAQARLERQIRQAGASVYATQKAFQSANVPPAVMEKALGRLIYDATPVNARGAIKKAVNLELAAQDAQLAAERKQQADENAYGLDAYWAEALGEKPDTARTVLYGRTTGIIRALARRNPRQNLPA